MKQDAALDLKKLVHPSYEEPTGYKVEIVTLDKNGQATDDREQISNPRLLINVPADKMFIEITQTKPAYMIVVSRVDQEINTLGLLEKAKDMVKAFCAVIDSKRTELTRGVREAHALLKERKS